MKTVRAVSLVLRSFFPGIAAAQTPDPAAKIDEIFAQWKSQESPGCTVAVGEGGEDPALPRLRHGGPGARRAHHARPRSSRRASVSKQFTATAAFLLVQQGKLSLTDDVRKYVPELPDYGKPITIDHLIHHTSGFRDWGGVAAVSGWPRGTRIHTHAHMLDIASRQKALNYEPGAEFSYTNTGYNLLAVIVGRVSGKLADFTRQNIFEPLGMKTHLVARRLHPRRQGTGHRLRQGGGRVPQRDAFRKRARQRRAPDNCRRPAPLERELHPWKGGRTHPDRGVATAGTAQRQPGDRVRRRPLHDHI